MDLGIGSQWGEIDDEPAALGQSYWSEAARPAGEPAEPESRWAALRRALTTRRGRVRTRDIVLFVRHLSTLLTAGLPLSKSLRTVARQLENPTFSDVVLRLSNDVQSGEMLSSAMSLVPGVFDSLVVNIVRAGEIGGTLPKTLTELAEEMEGKEALRRTVAGALIYPCLVIGIAVLIVGFLLVYVVPTFEDVYRKMHLELPFITRALLAVSAATVSYWWLGILALATLLVARRRVMKTDRARRAWDRFLLRLPVVGRTRRGAIAARFLSTFATLIGSGVTIVEALRLMSALTDNLLLRDAIDDVRQHVNHGSTIAEPLERYVGLFTPMAVSMISVGEETGSLPESATRAAGFLAQEVHERVKAMTTLIEPLLTVGLGLVVGMIALAIYLPMFDLMKNVSH